MVARGDLGAELPVEDVPYWQNQIVQGCRRRSKPVIVATNMVRLNTVQGRRPPVLWHALGDAVPCAPNAPALAALGVAPSCAARGAARPRVPLAAAPAASWAMLGHAWAMHPA